MTKHPEPASSLIAGQNLYLRLLIILFALIGTIESSARQLLVQMAIMTLFHLLDLKLFSQTLRGLRFSLPFLAAYSLFATLFNTAFPDMILFLLKIAYFIEVMVYAFGNLSLKRVLADTARVRRTKAGNLAIRFILATMIFVRLYYRHFTRNKPKMTAKLGELLDYALNTGAQVFQQSKVVEEQIERSLRDSDPAPRDSRANLIALSLMALMVLSNSL